MPLDSIKKYVLAAFAGLALAALFVLWLRNDRAGQFKAGYAKATLEQQAATAEILRQRRAEDAATREEIEKRDANYRAQILATKRSADAYAAESDRLRRYVETLRSGRGTNVSQAKPRSDDPVGKDWIGVYAECLADRTALVRDVAVYADRLKGLQDYVNGLPHMQPKK